MFPEISAAIINIGFDPKYFEALPRTADIVEQYGDGLINIREAVMLIVDQIR